MVKITVNEPFSPLYFRLYNVTFCRKRDGVLVFSGDDNETILTAARFTFSADTLASVDGAPYTKLCDTVSRPPKNRRKARKDYTRRDTVTVICDGVEKIVDRPVPCDTVSRIPTPAESPAYFSGVDNAIAAEVFMECWKRSGRTIPVYEDFKAAYASSGLKMSFEIA